MIEAVGHEFLPAFFQVLRDRVRPGGTIALQAILCPDAYYDKYRASSDFIKKHIFPGGHLPSIGAINGALPKELRITDTTHIGPHYATTLDFWRTAWLQKRQEILRLGYSTTFFRKWEFYFSLCAALFAYGNIHAAQLTLRKSA
ncbi:Protein F13D12.9 [Aphelenchoides avenae]|nr:Protein F13D12.9 [Aphelenchus avenae]